MVKRIICLLLLLALLGMAPLAEAEETQAAAPTPICTAEDLLAIKEDPSGSYILMADLDMTGILWESLDFSGSFDGNGYAILNLTIAEPGQEMPVVYDGNWKPYEAACFGFFGTLRNARVENLQLLNVRGLVSWDGPVFMGALAGYAEYTTIVNCTVTANLELRAHDRIFGLGGLVGYGKGVVENSSLDVTLINVDTDAETLDEQFLGGICAIGFMDIYDCTLKLDGYVSDHGYVHSGGVVGMYMEYPWTYGEVGNIKGLTLEGKITFFEDNRDRRAYCGAVEGEMLIGWYYTDRNEINFIRDERFSYDVELRPEMCEAPVFTEAVTPPGCEEYGYTTYTCATCGHTFRDHYVPRTHIVSEWTLTKNPTVEETGLSVGCCPCGREFTREEPKLAPPPATVPETEPPAAEDPAWEEIPVGVNPVLYIVMGSGCLLVLLAVILRKRK